MFDIMEFIRWFLQKNSYKNPKYVLHSLKTIQKSLIFWNLLSFLIKQVLIKNFKFILLSLYFLGIFRNHSKMFAIFEFIR